MSRVHGRNGTLVLRTENGTTEYVVTEWVIETYRERWLWPRIEVRGYVCPEEKRGMR